MKTKSVRRSLRGGAAVVVVVAALVAAGTVSPAGALDPTGSSPPPAGATAVKWHPLTCGTVTTKNGVETISAYGKVKAEVLTSPGDATYYQKSKLQVMKWTGVGSGAASGAWRASGTPADSTHGTWKTKNLKTWSTPAVRSSMIPAGAEATVKAVIQINRVRKGADTTVWKYETWAPKSVICPAVVGEKKLKTTKKVKQPTLLPGLSTPTPSRSTPTDSPATDFPPADSPSATPTDSPADTDGDGKVSAKEKEECAQRACDLSVHIKPCELRGDCKPPPFPGRPGYVPGGEAPAPAAAPASGTGPGES